MTAAETLNPRLLTLDPKPSPPIPNPQTRKLVPDVRPCHPPGGWKENESFLNLSRRTGNLRRPERARNEGPTGPKHVSIVYMLFLTFESLCRGERAGTPKLNDDPTSFMRV